MQPALTAESRDSSFELLRIIAMFSIVIFHFAIHGGFNFPVNSITLNKLYYQFLCMGGNIGNNIFILISGYFLVKSKEIKVQKILDLWLKMFFYGVVFFLLFTFLHIEKFSVKGAIKTLVPIPFGGWWFAQTYFVLYLFHPYVNILLKSFSKEDYKKFLILIFISWSIIPTFTTSPFQGNSLINFICLYSLAGYFSLWEKDFGSKKFIFYGLFFIMLNFLSAIFLDVVGLKISIAGKHALYFIEPRHEVGMMRPFTILATVCLLIGFRSLKIRYNKIINIIASATFGVYLIHEHYFVRPFLWLKVFKNFSFQDSPYLIPYSIGVAILVYVLCTFIELGRSKIFRLISNGKFS